MKLNNYHIVFKVSIFHSYFENNSCTCLSISPKPATAFLLKRFGFIIRNTINGIEFYSNSSNVTDLLTYIGKTTALTSFDFELNTATTNFNYFTDLPMNWIGQLAYDTQSKLNQQEQDVTCLVPQLNSEVYQPILGALVIHFNDLIKSGSNKTPVQFAIKYKARATQWQYFIINKSAIKLDNPKIIGKSGFEFEGPQNVIIETGEKALLFSSNKNLIPLNILPAYKFDLIDSQIPVKTLIKGLPNPEAGGLRSDNKSVSSPMYVYV